MSCAPSSISTLRNTRKSTAPSNPFLTPSTAKSNTTVFFAFSRRTLSEAPAMPHIPKTDVPSLGYFFLLLTIAGLTVFGVGVGLLAAGDALKSVGRFFHELLWVLR